jgi:NADPH:quinone reductase-like Zn-dependent oxidoreductase
VKAARLDAFGGPENLVYGDLPDPSPASGRAIVKVGACSLNHLDLWVRAGNPAYKIELPHVLGNDIAGTVESFGPQTETPGISKGDRVIVSPGVSCGRCGRCEQGRDNLCQSYAILGADGGWGGYAEFVSVPAENLIPMPASLSFEEAASFPLAYLTAYHMLNGLAQVRSGQTVVVVGSGSGVGAAAIQIAKHLGARVLAASSSEKKREAAAALGADETLASPPERLSRAIRKAAGKGGVDVVFEHVGGEFFSEAIKCLRPGGAIVTCGATAGPEVPLDLRRVFFKELKILGAKMGTRKELREVAGLFAAGKLRPCVDTVFPLSEARRAHEHLSERKQFGKVVLRP